MDHSEEGEAPADGRAGVKIPAELLRSDLLASITWSMVFCLLDCEAGHEKMACGILPLRF